MTDPTPVELLARGYTREQISAWQTAVVDDETPGEDDEDTKSGAGRRRKA